MERKKEYLWLEIRKPIFKLLFLLGLVVFSWMIAEPVYAQDKARPQDKQQEERDRLVLPALATFLDVRLIHSRRRRTSPTWVLRRRERQTRETKVAPRAVAGSGSIS